MGEMNVDGNVDGHGSGRPQAARKYLILLAGWTRLELATSGVTGRRSNQLNYHPASSSQIGSTWWEVWDLNPRPPACKAGALPLS